jgi:Protein of unknown function (DUF1592)/Protein of unknown function (DUF1588)
MRRGTAGRDPALKPGNAVLALALAVAGGCTGYIGNTAASGSGGNGGGGNDAAIADGGPSVVNPGMRRLTVNELRNTVQDLLTAALVNVPGAASQAFGDLAPALAQYPADTPVSRARDPQLGAGFTRLDTDVTQGHVDAIYTIAAAFAAELTSSTSRIGSVFGSCAVDADPSNDASCLSTFVTTFGALVLRRPVTSDDVAFYTDVYPETGGGGDPDAAYGAAPADAGANGPVTPKTLAAVVTLMMNSPDFVYHVENGDPSSMSTIAPLTAYEVASRLSYNFWETMPDLELRTKAADGSLLQPAVLAAEATRLINDPRAAAPMAEFFAQWLRVNILPALDNEVGTNTFTNFAAGYVPTAQTTQNAINDVTSAAAWVTLHGGSLDDLLTNRQSFAKTSDIATLYGVPTWDGTGTPPTPTDPTRVGLITRIAFLASGYVDTNPILKGVGIRLALLCYPLQPPPAVAMGKAVLMSPTQTTRQQTEALTQSGQPCVSCHGLFINPLGFATENFDALGRSRTTEDLFDNFGNIVAKKPVDTESIPQVVPGDMTPSTGAGDLTKQLVASGLVGTCFAQNYFEYTFGRLYESPTQASSDQTSPNPEADQATVAAIAAVANKSSMLDAFESIVSQPEFLQKSFQ